MTHEPSRYLQDLDDDGKSGLRPAVNQCPGKEQCSERIGGAVLIGYGIFAIVCTTIGLITGCKIGHASATAQRAAPIEATP
jgi:hypothetical protein